MKTMILKTLLLSQIIIFTHAAYDRCDLARTLVYEHYFDNQLIADWICIVEHGRNLNKDELITTESSGHGLLQIPSLWCQNSQECVKSCRAHSDEYIGDDAACAKYVFEETEKVTGNGFSAWRIWKSNCRGRKLDHYIAGCFEDMKKEYPNSVEFSGVTQSPMQRMPPRTLTTKRYKRRRYPRKGKTYKNRATTTSPLVESIKIFSCSSSDVKCEFRPNSVLYKYRCQFSQPYTTRKLKTPSRENYTEGNVEAIKIYDCGNFFMKCDYNPDLLSYPYGCEFLNPEDAPY